MRKVLFLPRWSAKKVKMKAMVEEKAKMKV